MLLEPHGWMARGECVNWDWSVLAPYIAANALIAAAYFAIPVLLFVYLRRTKHDDLPRWTVQAFIVFIAACGSGHVVKIVNVWLPWYWLATGVDWLTAIFSVATACALPIAGARLLARPSRDEMTDMLDRVQQARRHAVNPKTIERLNALAEGIQAKLDAINSGFRRIQR